jgi:hypothetical protein
MSKPWSPEEAWMKRGALKASADNFPERSMAAMRLRGQRLGLPDRSSLKVAKQSWVERRLDQILSGGTTATSNQIRIETGFSMAQICKFLNRGHGTKYRIQGWAKRANGCDWQPVWGWGTEPDADRPAPKPNAELRKNYTAKLKRRQRNFNPFATAAGLISAPATTVSGRIVMNLHDFEEAA